MLAKKVFMVEINHNRSLIEKSDKNFLNSKYIIDTLYNKQLFSSDRLTFHKETRPLGNSREWRRLITGTRGGGAYLAPAEALMV